MFLLICCIYSVSVLSDVGFSGLPEKCRSTYVRERFFFFWERERGEGREARVTSFYNAEKYEGRDKKCLLHTQYTSQWTFLLLFLTHLFKVLWFLSVSVINPVTWPPRSPSLSSDFCLHGHMKNSVYRLAVSFSDWCCNTKRPLFLSLVVLMHLWGTHS